MTGSVSSGVNAAKTPCGDREEKGSGAGDSKGPGGPQAPRRLLPLRFSLTVIPGQLPNVG